MAMEDHPVALETYKCEDGRIGLRTADTKRPVLGIIDLYVDDQLEKLQRVDVELHTKISRYDPASRQKNTPVEVDQREPGTYTITVPEE